jgi:hypothetical protein
MDPLEFDVDSFILDWKSSIENNDDKKIYTLLLKFQSRIIPNFYLPKISMDNQWYQLIPLFQETFPQIIDENYDKSSKIRKLLTNIYSETFNPTPSNGSLESTVENNKDNSEIISNPNNPNMNTDIITPLDSKGSEFFKSKTREIIEKNIMHFFQLYKNTNSIENVRKELTALILYLIGIFNEAPELLIKKLLVYLDLDKITLDEFEVLLKKCLDKEPSSIIYILVSYVQEMMLDVKLNTNAVMKMEKIMELFAEYVEYFPDFFSSHINLYVGLVGRYRFNLTRIVSKILLFYAKHGEDKIDELFFELYFKTAELEDDEQTILVEVLHESFGINYNFILNIIYEDSQQFDKDLERKINKNLKSKNKEFQELTFEIAIGIWKYKLEMALNSNFEVTSANNQKSKEESIPESKKLFKSLRSLLKQMISEKIYSTYLFLEIIDEYNHFNKNLNPNHKSDEILKQFVDEDNISSKDNFFKTIAAFNEFLSDR